MYNEFVEIATIKEWAGYFDPEDFVCEAIYKFNKKEESGGEYIIDYVDSVIEQLSRAEEYASIDLILASFLNDEEYYMYQTVPLELHFNILCATLFIRDKLKLRENYFAYCCKLWKSDLNGAELWGLG